MTSDRSFLTRTECLSFNGGELGVRVVDLFAGAGGLTVGLAEAARVANVGIDVALAGDFDPAPVEVFRHNFPKANVPDAAGVEAFFDGELGSTLTPREAQVSHQIGQVDWLHGGPPCQGHSDLNNRTRRDDPRNMFYERMARAAEVLTPQVVLIENVPPVRNATGNVVDHATTSLIRAGYDVADGIVDFHDLGVPQTRKRHTVLGLRDVDIAAAEVLGSLGGKQRRTVRWAIGDLVDAQESPLDVPTRMSSANLARARWLIEENEFNLPNERRPRCHQGNHSYVSMYGRMRWNKPAQTVTSGFGSMGQGRYLHPSEMRTVTPHEAARLQFFPDWFDFTAGGLETRRGKWAMMIGNAVPPKLTMELGRVLLPHLTV